MHNYYHNSLTPPPPVGMSNARETVVQLHKKAERRMALLEERSLVQLSREGASHSRALRELETELEQARKQLEEVKQEYRLKGNSHNVIGTDPNVSGDSPSIEHTVTPISAAVETPSEGAIQLSVAP